jgi:cyclopropane fatty-acyl-phospholipid synthase-like methyltransferase
MTQGHAHDPWEAEAAAYARKADLLEPALGAVAKALLDAVQAGPGQRLLDLGCGPGHLTEAARLRGAHAVGLDRSSAMVAAARHRFPAAAFAVGDMDDPPAGPWHAIVSRFAAHHAQGAWLGAAHKVLGPGGRIAIAEVVPTAEGDRPGGHGKLEPSEWRRRFEAAGFLDVELRRCHVQVPAAHHGGHAWPETWIIGGRRP